MSEIATTRGPMDDSLLTKKEGTFENENERTAWVEYWLDGELVHRSAHVILKKHPSVTISPGDFLRG